MPQALAAWRGVPSPSRTICAAHSRSSIKIPSVNIGYLQCVCDLAYSLKSISCSLLSVEACVSGKYAIRQSSSAQVRHKMTQYVSANASLDSDTNAKNLRRHYRLHHHHQTR